MYVKIDVSITLSDVILLLKTYNCSDIIKNN